MKGEKQKRIYTRTRMAVGLDISSTSIAMAVLKLDKSGLRLVRAARRPINSGLKANPRVLKRLSADLGRFCKVKGLHVTSSLFSPRHLMQIVEIPPKLNGPKGPYVNKEIRHYVALANVSVVSDYRDLPSSNDTERVFVVAGDSDNVSESVNACQQGGLNIEVVEPQMLAYVRALYHQRIAGRFGCNVLFALVRDKRISLWVMRERNIDFVRVHALKDDPENPEAILEQLLAQIKLIMQYYEIEVTESTGHWEVNVVADGDIALPEQARDVLSEGLTQVPVEILTSENIGAALSVDPPQGIDPDQISAVAVGHAMRNLSDEIVLPKINCLPPLIKEIQEIKRSMLWTAIGAAMILLIMGLATLVLIQKGDQIRTTIAVQRPNSAVGQVVDMRGALEAEINTVGKIPKRLKEVLAVQKSVNWAEVLTDIRQMIPKDVSITRFDSRSDFSVFINGVALTSNDITLFLSRLNQSEHIDAVDLVKTDYRSGVNGHHTYEIRCQLTTQVGI